MVFTESKKKLSKGRGLCCYWSSEQETFQTKKPTEVLMKSTMGSKVSVLLATYLIMKLLMQQKVRPLITA
jgi:hypothetical protein